MSYTGLLLLSLAIAFLGALIMPSKKSDIDANSPYYDKPSNTDLLLEEALQHSKSVCYIDEKRHSTQRNNISSPPKSKKKRTDKKNVRGRRP